MIQRYGYLHNQVYHLNSFLQNYGQCQKIYSTPHFLCFSLRRPSESLWIYLGRGGEFQGLWMSKSAPDATLRIQDTFLSLVRKYLISPWNQIILDQLDRIICIKANYFGKFQYFLFFWHGYESYFLQHYFDIDKKLWVLHKSWDSNNKIQFDCEQGLESLFSIFDEVGRRNLNDKTIPSQEESKIASAHQLEIYFAKNLNINQLPQKNPKQLRKIENIKQDLEKLSQFNSLKNYLDTYPENIPDNLNFNGLKIKFAETMSNEQRRNFAFIKLKNWRKNYELMNLRLNNEQQKLKDSPKKPKLDRIIGPVWKSKKHHTTKTNKTEFTDCLFYKSEKFNVLLAIGKTALANDRLRNSWSIKSDYWFHLTDQPSAHLYVRFLGAINFSMDLLSSIGSILLTQSNLKTTSCNLIYCLAKDLKSIKGQAGAVTFKNEKRIMVFFDKNWNQYFLN